MEYNKESFKKALKECGIVRWENHFEKVVKAYLKAEAEQLTISGVVGQSEQSNCVHYHEHILTVKTLKYKCKHCGDEKWEQLD